MFPPVLSLPAYLYNPARSLRVLSETSCGHHNCHNSVMHTRACIKCKLPFVGVSVELLYPPGMILLKKQQNKHTILSHSTCRIFSRNMLGHWTETPKTPSRGEGRGGGVLVVPPGSLGLRDVSGSKIYILSALYKFNFGWADLSFKVVQGSNCHEHHNSKRLTHVQHNSGAFVACLIVFCRRYPTIKLQ